MKTLFLFAFLFVTSVSSLFPICIGNCCQSQEDQLVQCNTELVECHDEKVFVINNNDALQGGLNACNSKLKCFKRQYERTKKMKDIQRLVYEASLYWHASKIVAGIEPFPDEVSDDAVEGRVNQLAYSADKPFLIEYFSVLTAFGQDWCVTAPNGTQICGLFYNTEGEDFNIKVNATGLSFDHRFGFHLVTGDINQPGNYTIHDDIVVNITQTGSFRFNCDEDPKILAFKLDVPYLTQQGKFNGKYPPNKQAQMERICGVHQFKCAGTPYQQYTDMQDCFDFLATVDVGLPDILGVANSTTCREFHIALTLQNPAVHCNHLGKDSMKCRDFTIDQYYDGLYYLNIPDHQNDPQDCAQDWYNCWNSLEDFDPDQCS